VSRLTTQLLELAKNGITPEAIRATSDALQVQQDREARQALQVAFKNLQAELPQIDHNDQIVRNGEVIATFSSYEKLHEILQPLLTKYDFTVTRHTAYAGPNKGDVTVIVTHMDGATLESSFPIIASDWSGEMSEVQAIASGETFAARRALCGCLNLVTRGADKDGEEPFDIARPQVFDRQPPENYSKRMKFLETAATKGPKGFAKAFKDCEQDVKDWAVAHDLANLNRIKSIAVTPKAEGPF
jgi:hypothetical protein